jgi:hypothetical protein
VEIERDRWSLSDSAHQFSLDRNRVTEEVKYRAVGVNSRSQFFVASWGFRPIQVNPNAHGIEAGPDTVVDTQESAQVDVTVDAYSTLSSVIPS